MRDHHETFEHIPEEAEISRIEWGGCPMPITLVCGCTAWVELGDTVWMCRVEEDEPFLPCGVDKRTVN